MILQNIYSMYSNFKIGVQRVNPYFLRYSKVELGYKNKILKKYGLK